MADFVVSCALALLAAVGAAAGVGRRGMDLGVVVGVRALLPFEHDTK